MLRSTIGVAALVIGCGSVTDSRTRPSAGGTASAAGGTTSASGGTTSADGASTDSGGGAASGGNIASGGGSSGAGGGVTFCGSQTYDTAASALDMLILVEQAASMSDVVPDGGTRWTSVQAAVGSFIGTPAVSVVNAGIQYFPLGGDAGSPCTAAYDVPDVELAPLSSNAPAIGASLQAHAPSGRRSPGPALAGALVHMKAWAQAHPGRTPVVVLLTDGPPADCEPQRLADLQTLARDAFATEPKVRTFVIGLGRDTRPAELDALAEAGGSTKAFAMDDGDIVKQVSQSLRSIVDTPLDCDFDLPRAEDPENSVDLSKLSVAYAPFATKVIELLQHRSSVSDCAPGDQGWYFDDARAPTKAVLCPGTCGRLGAGRVELLLSCNLISGQTP